MQESFGFKRFPSTERKVSDIGPDDVRISIIGTIIDKGDGKLTIDDGTGSINVFTEDEKTKNFSIGNRVRVIGRVNKDNGLSMNAEAIQDFSNFNLELYEKLKED